MSEAQVKNTGKEYEFFVAKLQQALLNADTITTQKNIKVEINKKIVDNSGIERQFDIYWEYELGGLTYKTIIECKDYSSSISVGKIDALVGKIRDIPDIKAVFATTKGYQSGAQKKAEQNKIELLIVREQNDSDWVDEDGTPLMKKVCINMVCLMPPRIHEFAPQLDKKWLEEHTSIDTTKPMNFSGMNNEIFIEDVAKNEVYSLHDLSSRLASAHQGGCGTFAKMEIFDNAFLRHGDTRLKLSGYKVGYSVSEPATSTMEIDFSKELDGVIEYLQKDTKKSIFRNGIVKEYSRSKCAGPRGTT
jgi:hypothetical protein